MSMKIYNYLRGQFCRNGPKITEFKIFEWIFFRLWFHYSAKNSEYNSSFNFHPALRIDIIDRKKILEQESYRKEAEKLGYDILNRANETDPWIGAFWFLNKRQRRKAARLHEGISSPRTRTWNESELVEIVRMIITVGNWSFSARRHSFDVRTILKKLSRRRHSKKKRRYQRIREISEDRKSSGRIRKTWGKQKTRASFDRRLGYLTDERIF